MSELFAPEPPGPKVLGLFGGTFDPIHYGHLRLAEEAISHLGLASVRWIPAGQPPHRGSPQVSPQHRLAMVLRSTASNSRFLVDPAEVLAARASYTIDTLERLRDELGATPALVLLVGADAFAGLASWHRWRELFALAHIAISHRPGFPIAASSLPPPLADEFTSRQQVDATSLGQTSGGQIVTFAMTQLAISATQIRKLLSNSTSARYLLPDSVLDYIQLHQLYRNA